MIIVVKIHNALKKGFDIKSASQRSWVLGSFIDNNRVRNNYRFLVAYANRTALKVYAIKGVGLDTPGKSNKRRIFFDLEEISESCELSIKNIIDEIIIEDPKKIVNSRPFSLIDKSYLSDQKILNKLDCHVFSDEIPVIKGLSQSDNETLSTDDEFNAGMFLPDNIYLKFSCEKKDWNSFSIPNNLITISQALVFPNGNVEFELRNNRSGKMSLVKNSLTPLEAKAVKKIMLSFHKNSNLKLQEIERTKNSHTSHLNNMKIIFESYKDRDLKIKISSLTWEGDVHFANPGILEDILSLFVKGN
jgi:hypothetical protein